MDGLFVLQEIMTKLRDYFSLSGSFSRIELLVATITLMAIGNGLAFLRDAHPELISTASYNLMIYALYPIWGAALGKRSRDLGTTFTYGMLIGMIFPVIGIVFLFQAGQKAKSEKRAEEAGASDRDNVPDSNRASDARPDGL